MNAAPPAGAAVVPDAVELAVVLPAWNERANLELLLPALHETLREIGVPYEIIVVDNRSTDGTAEAAVKRGARVVQQSERGYGGALLAGFAATRAAYVATMDADLSHRPVFLKEFWARREQAEMMIASRYVSGAAAHMGRFRALLSHILNRVYRRALSLPYLDLSSGMRLYRRDVVSGLPLRARDFDAVEEILIRVHNAGWRIAEVPFEYMARGSGRSHVRLLHFGWAYLRTLHRMWRLRNSVEAADYDFRAHSSVIWLQRYWQRERHRIILSMCERRDSVLDVGCGSSRIILDLPLAVGVDVARHKLRWLRRRHERAVCGALPRLPFRDASFDTVICSEVIEHVSDEPEVIGELVRVLRPGGVLVLGTPDYSKLLWHVIEWFYGRLLPDAYAEEHITRFTHESLRARLAALGLEVLECQYVGRCEMIFKARKPG